MRQLPRGGYVVFQSTAGTRIVRSDSSRKFVRLAARGGMLDQFQ